MKARAEKLYRFRVAVRGSVQFPIDMLRYDACYPETEHDAAEIESTFLDPKQTSVILTHVSDVPQGRITPDRWSSFLWRVVSIEPLKALDVS